MRFKFAILSGMLFAITSCARNSTTLAIRTSEFKYNPPVWTVPTGQPVRLINEGSEEHVGLIQVGQASDNAI